MMIKDTTLKIAVKTNMETQRLPEDFQLQEQKVLIEEVLQH